MAPQKDDLFLRAADVNGKRNDGFLIFISPTKTVMILSDELGSFIYRCDTLIDQIVFV